MVNRVLLQEDLLLRNTNGSSKTDSATASSALQIRLASVKLRTNTLLGNVAATPEASPRVFWQMRTVSLEVNPAHRAVRKSTPCVINETANSRSSSSWLVSRMVSASLLKAEQRIPGVDAALSLALVPVIGGGHMPQKQQYTP